MRPRTASRQRAFAALAVLLVLGLLAGCGGEEIEPPRGRADDSGQRADAATATLDALRSGLRDRDRSAVSALAAPDTASRRLVAGIYANAASLDVSDLSLRYVDVDRSTLPSRTGAYGDAAFAATVAVRWRLGVDRSSSREDVRFVFVSSKGKALLADVGGGTGRAPLWLVEPLRVERDGSTLVLAASSLGSRLPTYAARARQAVRDVRLVLPRWRGPLVVEVPSSQDVLEEVLDVPSGTYRAIAGVTTTVDGSVRAGSPVHVFLNPAVYDGLGPRGAQVVLSHESTHVAAQAPFAATTMPTWLLEGFADYVALAHARIPLATAGRQIIARVRKEGPPSDLPTKADLDPSAPGLGATYEEAWTVCRYLAARYGESALVRFYDAVDDGTQVDRAFGQVLGTQRSTFVAGWRADLARIAGS